MISIDNLSDSKVALIYGQMNEPPGARMRVGLSALTIAEYFREELQQVGMAWWIGLMDSQIGRASCRERVSEIV